MIGPDDTSAIGQIKPTRGSLSASSWTVAQCLLTFESGLCSANTDFRFGPIADIAKKRETASQRSLRIRPHSLSQSTGALRKARAGTKGEARVDLGCARGDLQRLIGNVQKKNLFLCFQYNIRHHIDPFVCALAN